MFLKPFLVVAISRCCFWHRMHSTNDVLRGSYRWVAFMHIASSKRTSRIGHRPKANRQKDIHAAIDRKRPSHPFRYSFVTSRPHPHSTSRSTSLPVCATCLLVNHAVSLPNTHVADSPRQPQPHVLHSIDESYDGLVSHGPSEPAYVDANTHPRVLEPPPSEMTVR